MPKDIYKLTKKEILALRNVRAKGNIFSGTLLGGYIGFGAGGAAGVLVGSIVGGLLTGFYEKRKSN